MWIEAVRLEGFKSFREKTEIQFQSGHNLVIGHNGAGKSNLLHAVSSIIDVPSVSREDRLHLISRNSTQARIQVVFNNESRRLPYQTDKGEKSAETISTSRHFNVLFLDSPFVTFDRIEMPKGSCS